jgi:hypothetical protein
LKKSTALACCWKAIRKAELVLSLTSATTHARLDSEEPSLVRIGGLGTLSILEVGRLLVYTCGTAAVCRTVNDVDGAGVGAYHRAEVGASACAGEMFVTKIGAVACPALVVTLGSIGSIGGKALSGGAASGLRLQ